MWVKTRVRLPDMDCARRLACSPAAHIGVKILHELACRAGPVVLLSEDHFDSGLPQGNAHGHVVAKVFASGQAIHAIYQQHIELASAGVAQDRLELAALVENQADSASRWTRGCSPHASALARQRASWSSSRTLVGRMLRDSTALDHWIGDHGWRLFGSLYLGLGSRRSPLALIRFVPILVRHCISSRRGCRLSCRPSSASH